MIFRKAASERIFGVGETASVARKEGSEYRLPVSSDYVRVTSGFHARSSARQVRKVEPSGDARTLKFPTCFGHIARRWKW